MTVHQCLYSLSMNSMPNASHPLNCAFFTVCREIAFLNNTKLALLSGSHWGRHKNVLSVYVIAEFMMCKPFNNLSSSVR